MTTTSTLSRRNVAKGAAWSIPAIAIGVSAPAASASTTCTPTGMLKRVHLEAKDKGRFGGNVQGLLTSCCDGQSRTNVQFLILLDGVEVARSVIYAARVGIPTPTYTFENLRASKGVHTVDFQMINADSGAIIASEQEEVKVK